MRPVVVTVTEEPLAVSIATEVFGPVDLPMTPALLMAAEQLVATARGLAGMPQASTS